MPVDTGSPNQSVEEMMKKIVSWTTEMQARLDQLQPVLQPIGEEIVAMAQMSQQKRETPMGVPFSPLRASTLQLYSEGPYRGSTGALKSSFQINVTNNQILITNSQPYANAQFYGNPLNKMFGRQTAPVPARPYLDIVGGQLTFPPDKITAWKDKILRYVVEGNL